ncbi:hypothetical protein OAB57_02030 [Bacteriovoracaceae bacterium]|nr:hypothetical protein [Bacteriovoracaceae bacterium]
MQILTKDARLHMVQYLPSIRREITKDCNYIYLREQSQSRVKTCIKRKKTDNDINESLQMINHPKPGIFFSFLRGGKGLDPHSLDQYLKFEFPKLTRPEFTKIYLSAINLQINYNRSSSQGISRFYFRNYNYILTVSDHTSATVLKRSYDCSRCPEPFRIHVMKKDNEISYFRNNITDQLAPHVAQKILSNRIIKIMGLAGKILQQGASKIFPIPKYQ